ncbi:glycosyltransferase [Candidatus Saccharibacteria bacterium]|nr:glycosyltransferase [Candidatus Saccharibacteria bacterium]
MDNKRILEPWEIDFEERVRDFESAKNDGKKIALYYAKAPDSSTYRYRVYNVYETSRQSKEWRVAFFYRNEIETIESLIPKADLFIYSRQSRWDKKIKKLSLIAKENKIPLLFDLDDLVFDKKYIMTVVNTIGETNNFDFWIPYFDRIQKTAERVDGFLVTNDYLGERIGKNFNKPYRVIRNSLNSAQIAASNAYLRFKKYPSEHKKFVIGYFSGSPTHVNDLAVALPEVLEFLDSHKDAVLRVVGLMDFDERIRKYYDRKQIEFVPPVDFRKLQRLMSEVDVNIAPLVINEFTNCKSELKFFEAAIVETTTIASPTYTFKRAISDGKNGFLACPSEWYDKLEYLYKHSEENRKIALVAKKYAMKHYYGKEFLKEVEVAYDYFAK